MAANASKARALFPRAGSGKKTRHEPMEDNNAPLGGADVAWQQYKKGQGKRVTSSEELKGFPGWPLDSFQLRSLPHPISLNLPLRALLAFVCLDQFGRSACPG